jgi:hypothetical protein
MKTECDFCGKELDRKKSSVKKWKTHFCDKKCQIDYMKKNNKDITK